MIEPKERHKKTFWKRLLQRRTLNTWDKIGLIKTGRTRELTGVSSLIFTIQRQNWTGAIQQASDLLPKTFGNRRPDGTALYGPGASAIGGRVRCFGGNKKRSWPRYMSSDDFLFAVTRTTTILLAAPLLFVVVTFRCRCVYGEIGKKNNAINGIIIRVILQWSTSGSGDENEKKK